ncbi:MAG: hypothetical protein JST93_35595 [Acidobacteria bacterium]|nr:hypothetical protein [Acidobacteriota bacterium]
MIRYCVLVRSSLPCSAGAGDEQQAERWIGLGFNVISWKADIGLYRGALTKEVQ